MDYDDSHDINVVGLIKGREKYVFLYDDKSRAELFRTFDRFASNSELSFNLFAAEILIDRLSQATEFQQTGDTRCLFPSEL